MSALEGIGQASLEFYRAFETLKGAGNESVVSVSAIVGDPDQVLGKIQRYIEMGMRAFILSGYPHRDECELFGRYVLPRISKCVLAREQNRLVDNPVTPLTTAPRR